jgi:hypothetical protein
VSALSWLSRRRVRSRYAQLQADVEALDRGVIEAGVTAGHPLAKTAQGPCRRPGHHNLARGPQR